MSYDQWKTASPYDDDPDPIEEAERFLKDNEKRRELQIEIERACLVVECLMLYIENNI